MAGQMVQVVMVVVVVVVQRHVVVVVVIVVQLVRTVVIVRPHSGQVRLKADAVMRASELERRRRRLDDGRMVSQQTQSRRR